ncbi:MAG TPA: hypothetical protein VGL83_06900 [Stellaceae bacterium]|jgi:signal recognition particle GTPase
MAVRRDSTQPAEKIGGETSNLDEAAAAPETASLVSEAAPAIDLPSDDDTLLPDALRSHSLGNALVQRLVKLASAPQHTARAVDRLAIALGAQFDFFALNEARQAPLLLCGMPGAGVSTLAAKLAAPFEQSEVLVISAGAQDQDKTARLAEQLEALDLPLTVAPDAAALVRAIASAAGRKVIVDAGGQSPLGRNRLQEFASAAGTAGMLVMSAEMANAEAISLAKTASALGIGRMIVTRFDTARYLGPVLNAADAAKLALVGASVSPQFGFGLRALGPENLARRMIAAALHAERWRVMPL